MDVGPPTLPVTVAAMAQPTQGIEITVERCDHLNERKAGTECPVRRT